jgi:predicted alpha/beta-hydrolase family hydrolase
VQIMSGEHALDTCVAFSVDGTRRVSALLRSPPGARACVVLAHGAGAGMLHPAMEKLADGLSHRRFATFRYQFPYMEAGSKRPDLPPVAHATVRAAVAEASRLAPGLPLIAGGRSFGGRMTSQAQAGSPLPLVRGLVFFAFPLHPPKEISGARGAHLSDVRIPMLFLQGGRDAMADPHELARLIEGLGERARVEVLAGADHSFHVPARSGRTDTDVLDEALDAFAAWSAQVIA